MLSAATSYGKSGHEYSCPCRSRHCNSWSYLNKEYGSNLRNKRRENNCTHGQHLDPVCQGKSFAWQDIPKQAPPLEVCRRPRRLGRHILPDNIIRIYKSQDFLHAHLESVIQPTPVSSFMYEGTSKIEGRRGASWKSRVEEHDAITLRSGIEFHRKGCNS